MGYNWLVTLGQFVWQSLPWLTSRGLPWWADAHNPAHLGWRDPEPVGGWVHRWGSLLVAGISLYIALSNLDVRQFNP